MILDRGARDGLESGNVLGLFRSEGQVPIGGRMVPLPEQQYGLVLIFRVFNKGILRAGHDREAPGAHIDDIVRNP